MKPRDIHLKPIAEIVALFRGTESLETHVLRTNYIKEFGFWILAQESLSLLSKITGDRPFIDLMCGTGYVSLAMREAGHKVFACDSKEQTYGFKQYSPHVKITSWQNFLSRKKKELKKGAVVFVSWPYMDSEMFEIAIYLRETYPQTTLLYVGEDKSGCTADDSFFVNFQLEYLDTHDGTRYHFNTPEFGLHTISFFGIHDKLCRVQLTEDAQSA